jgi:uncharacterized ion transporter superfamily protein YfcC
MEHVFFWIIMAGVGIWFMKMKAEKTAEKNRELRLNYINDPKKNENPLLKKDDSESKVLIIASSVFLLMAFIALLVMTYNKRNPIIEKK